MNTAGRPRREAILALLPAEPGVIVDVGADHGHVAHAASGIATERMPGRTGRSDVDWVICDGLAAFRSVDTAIVAGMGARTISGILERGPTPKTVILHAQDDPPRLRLWLAAHGWRIDAERLAPEGGRFAEVIRAVRGDEATAGLLLELGPVLLGSEDPWLREHLEELSGWYGGIAAQTAGHVPDRHRWAAERRDFIDAVRAARWPAK